MQLQYFCNFCLPIISGAENGFRPRVTSLMRFMIISYLRHVTDYVRLGYVHLVLIHFQKLKIWKSKKKPKNTINIFTIYPFFSFSEFIYWWGCYFEFDKSLVRLLLSCDQPKPNPRDPGKWFGIDQITSSPLIIVAPKALKKSLSPRIFLLRFSSLRVHCLIEVTWLPYSTVRTNVTWQICL